MNIQRFTITDELVMRNMQEHIGIMRLAGKVPEVEIREKGKKRSLDQNALSFALYRDIAERKEDETPQDIRRYCKLHHGIPILRSEDQRFCEIYDKSIKDNLSYEEKLEAMDWFPVTSLMNKKQFSRYVEVITDDYARQGIHVTAMEYE